MSRDGWVEVEIGDPTCLRCGRNVLDCECPEGPDLGATDDDDA